MNPYNCYFTVKYTGISSLLECMNLQQDDTILYLGGRIDDDNLYPANYRKYLNFKIKELNPKKIYNLENYSKLMSCLKEEESDVFYEGTE